MLFDNLSNINRYSENKAGIEANKQKGKKTLQQGTEPKVKHDSGDKKEVDEKKVKIALDHANNQVKLKQTSCEFSYNEKVNRISIKVKNQETDEVIREIPAEDTLKMIEKMQELSGIILDEKG